MKIGRNDPCHCGSGLKYKKCCEAKAETVRTEQLAAEQAKLPDTLDADEAEKMKRREDAATHRAGFQSTSKPGAPASRATRARKRTV